ncbi:MAG: N(4)-(beta-N-acetylglucosaminyl)-L-asparaginase [Longimicrobiales bacterium]
MPDRRQFLKHAAGAAALGSLAPQHLLGAPAIRRSAPRPVAIASANGLAAVGRAIEVIQGGGDTLEGVVSGVNIVELDPEDRSVGYGGLPNADGVVQLDSSVMHGPTRGAGAVAALEGVRTPSRVAVAVMRYTDHVLLVGDGARRFARHMGFDVEQELLTDESRRVYLRWLSRLSPDDDWLTPAQSGEPVTEFPTAQQVAPGGDLWPRTPTGAGQAPRPSSNERALLDAWDGVRPMGTINCNAVDAAGNLSGVTTTSGLFFKIPGRVGDSPIIGAGLYVDNDVGACGSTGRGEAVIKTCGSHTVVENMRRGMSPTDACLDALRRVLDWTVEDRLREDGRPNFNVNYYAVNKAGEFGAAAIFSGSRYAVNVDGAGEIRDSGYLLEAGD